jgi:very-short-patch-repair endonuclease
MRPASSRDDNDVSKRRLGKTDQARRLRRSETEEEYRLWGDLRNRLLNGHKFARQIPIGPYIVDFICRESHLIIEVDGSQHANDPADQRRTQWLNEQGYAVLRFWNHEVMRERRSVLEMIVAALEKRPIERDEVAGFYPAIQQSEGKIE